jgi:hypothetical protein
VTSASAGFRFSFSRGPSRADLDAEDTPSDQTVVVLDLREVEADRPRQFRHFDPRR